ncbi:hypothetical protein AD998_19975 [bacterium 336/3]|nr:hypothetical protein AD998_19975 [bacterium 336/3]
MAKKASIVIGLGFGDEGKGLTTSFLGFQSPNSLVVRFNGGQQAGHTVCIGEKKHVFSNFGAGTFQNIPTYWSRFCTFSPSAFITEHKVLESLGIFPQIFIDNLCPVTTHYDILYNRLLEQKRGNQRHGSCGMGFGATIERHENSPVRLYAQDLSFPEIVNIKLKSIRAYYHEKLIQQGITDFLEMPHEQEDNRFLGYLSELQKLKNSQNISWVHEKDVFSDIYPFEHFIFEGAQGVLLDMDFGFFPNVTRSNTTSKNALELITRNSKSKISDINIWYASRCYHTRHGAGWFPLENTRLDLQNTENETNQLNDYQGFFRKAPLNLELLHYALQCDSNFSKGLPKNLVLTCADQLPNQECLVWGNGLEKMNVSSLSKRLQPHFEKLLVSFSADSEQLQNDNSI